ncbi:MAG TPA: aldehyde dehydrogenase family protein [Actinomycetota bacterium]|nr:aldehyde dehydrogenase family protein [Actinomycetota bacterium]
MADAKTPRKSSAKTTAATTKAAAPKKAPSRRSPSRSASKTEIPTLISTDPATGERLAEVFQTLPGEVAGIVENARKVAPEWAAIHPKGRAGILKEVRYRIHERSDDIVETISRENGKTRAEALVHDVLPTLLMFAYMERAVARTLKPQRIGRLLGLPMGASAYIDWRPFGVVGAIGPWNYPFFNTFLAFTSALFAGNTVVIKPSEVTPQVGELIKDVLEPLPTGVATVIQGGGDVGAALVDAPCDKISFIGSPGTGRRICEGAAKHLTPVVMELGGKDAAIVCSDANLDVATSGVLWGSFFNSGQTCCSVERIFVSDDIADRFTEAFAEKLAKLRQGSDGEIGPLTFKRQLDIVQRHVKDAIKDGARLVAGGPDEGRKNTNGSLWYAPTILDQVTDDMAVVREETFGPVVSITRVRDDEEALRRANSGFNLTASVWSKDSRRAGRIASGLKAGTVTINSHGDTLGQPWTPWGGVGESGFGRLGGDLGLKEFSVPVHVNKNLTPKLKRLWWYPYDDAMVDTIKAVATIVGSSDGRAKRKAVGTVVRNAGRVLRSRL